MGHGLSHISREGKDGTVTIVRPMMRRVQFESLLEMGDGRFGPAGCSGSRRTAPRSAVSAVDHTG